MAKMFYTFEEVREKLGVTEDQLKQLVQTGKLREFRDGAKVMFKVDEVDDFSLLDMGLEGSAEGTGETPISEDSSDLLGISDMTGSSIGLVPMDTGSQIGLIPSDTADQIGLEDTTEGVEKDDTVLTASGTDESQDESSSGIGITADQLDKTQLTSDLDDQVPLDASGSGSGSGLLDLSREADDTSLGAELLEEIYPSADQGAVETQLPAQMDIAPEPEAAAEEMEPQLSVVEQVRAAQFYDPTSGVFGAMLIVPFLVLIYMCCAATAALADVQPAILTKLNGMTMWYVLGGAAVLSLLILLIGNFMVSQAGQPRAPKVKKARQAKPKKAKKK